MSLPQRTMHQQFQRNNIVVVIILILVVKEDALERKKQPFPLPLQSIAASNRQKFQFYAQKETVLQRTQKRIFTPINFLKSSH